MHGNLLDDMHAMLQVGYVAPGQPFCVWARTHALINLRVVSCDPPAPVVRLQQDTEVHVIPKLREGAAKPGSVAASGAQVAGGPAQPVDDAQQQGQQVRGLQLRVMLMPSDLSLPLSLTTLGPAAAAAAAAAPQLCDGSSLLTTAVLVSHSALAGHPDLVPGQLVSVQASAARRHTPSSSSLTLVVVPCEAVPPGAAVLPAPVARVLGLAPGSLLRIRSVDDSLGMRGSEHQLQAQGHLRAVVRPIAEQQQQQQQQQSVQGSAVEGGAVAPQQRPGPAGDLSDAVALLSAVHAWACTQRAALAALLSPVHPTGQHLPLGLPCTAIMDLASGGPNGGDSSSSSSSLLLEVQASHPCRGWSPDTRQQLQVTLDTGNPVVVLAQPGSTDMGYQARSSEGAAAVRHALRSAHWPEQSLGLCLQRVLPALLGLPGQTDEHSPQHALMSPEPAQQGLTQQQRSGSSVSPVCPGHVLVTGPPGSGRGQLLRGLATAVGHLCSTRVHCIHLRYVTGGMDVTAAGG
jgi:hypothetical protein